MSLYDQPNQIGLYVVSQKIPGLSGYQQRTSADRRTSAGNVGSLFYAIMMRYDDRGWAWATTSLGRGGPVPREIYKYAPVSWYGGDMGTRNLVTSARSKIRGPWEAPIKSRVLQNSR